MIDGFDRVSAILSPAWFDRADDSVDRKRFIDFMTDIVNRTSGLNELGQGDTIGEKSKALYPSYIVDRG